MQKNAVPVLYSYMGRKSHASPLQLNGQKTPRRTTLNSLCRWPRPACKVVDDMIDHLKSHGTNEIIDLQEVFRALSLDTIAYCAFGIEINSFKDPNNVLTKRCIQAFTDLNFKNMIESLIVHTLGTV